MAKAKLPELKIDDSSIPYRVVIDFLEGTLRKQDAIAFARGFIEHHFESHSDCGYYVMPYEGGYIFEAQEGGPQRAYLPNLLKIIQEDPSSSACIQMARRVLEVKRAASGTYTSILLPEGMDSPNPVKAFPEAGPKMIPFERSGMVTLMAGLSVFGIGFIALLLATVVYLIQVSGLLKADMAKIDTKSLPLLQWPTMTSITAGGNQDKYIKTIRYQDGKWQWDTAPRHELIPTDTPPPAIRAPEAIANPMAPPGIPSGNPATPSLPPSVAPVLQRADTPGGGMANPPVASPPGTTLPQPPTTTGH